MNYKIELATLENLDEILNLYQERMEWIILNNINQKSWKVFFENHPKSEFIKDINQKRYYIIKENNKIIGGFELSTNSKLWKDDYTPAYYLYKVVTKINYKGIGKMIFQEVQELAKQANKKFIRINCVKSNKKLNEIYENYNFKLIAFKKSKYGTFALRELEIV